MQGAVRNKRVKVALHRLGNAAMSTRSQVLIAIAAAVVALASPLGVAGILLLAGGVGLWLFHSRRLGVWVLGSVAVRLSTSRVNTTAAAGAPPITEA